MNRRITAAAAARDMSESEARRISEAIARGMIEALDNRSDAIPDCDPLGDPNRIGSRIAAGFEMIARGES